MFTLRKSKPEKGNKFYTRKPKGYNTCVEGKPKDVCDALANCVGYAEGRFNEIISEIKGKAVFPYDTLYCNAENFIEKAEKLGLKISDVPVKGGIMVWQKGSTLKGDDGAGHVEIVEDVLEKDSKGNPTKIYDSSSSYGGTAFFNVTRTNSNGRWGLGSGYKFRGCIINPEVKEPEPVKPEPAPEPKPEPKPAETTFKAGDIVIIKGTGNANCYGTGRKAGGKGWTRKILKVYSGKPYPYRVGNSTGTTGYYKASALKKK